MCTTFNRFNVVLALKPFTSIPTKAISFNEDYEFGLNSSEIDAICSTLFSANNDAGSTASISFDLFEWFLANEFVNDGCIPMLDVFTAIILCSNGTFLEHLERLHALFTFEKTKVMQGIELYLLVTTYFNAVVLVLHGGDDFSVPDQDSIQFTLERMGIYQETQVDLKLFVELATSVLDVADQNGGNCRNDLGAVGNTDDTSVLSQSFAMFGCTFTPIPPQMEEQDGAVEKEFDKDDEEFGVEEEELDISFDSALNDDEPEEQDENNNKFDKQEKKEDTEKQVNKNKTAQKNNSQSIEREKKKYMMVADKLRIDNPGNKVAKYMTNDVIKAYNNIEEFRAITRNAFDNPTLPCCLIPAAHTAYDDYSLFYDGLIRDMHHATSDETSHPSESNWGTVETIGAQIITDQPKKATGEENNVLDVTVGVHLERNITAYPLSSALTTLQRHELEHVMCENIINIDQNVSLFSMEKNSGEQEEQEEQEDDNRSTVMVLAQTELSKTFDFGTIDFSGGDRYPTNVACGVFTDFPIGRGGASSLQDTKDGLNTIIQYGGENHLSMHVTSTMNMDQFTTEAALLPYQHIQYLHDALNQSDQISFAKSKNYGYSTSSVLDLGTGMKTTATIRYRYRENNKNKETKDRESLESILNRLPLGRLGVAVTTCTDEQDSTIQMINLSSRSTLFVKEEDIITSLLLAVQETLKGL